LGSTELKSAVKRIGTLASSFDDSVEIIMLLDCANRAIAVSMAQKVLFIAGREGTPADIGAHEGRLGGKACGRHMAR
jgi:hypothetical protein